MTGLFFAALTASSFAAPGQWGKLLFLTGAAGFIGWGTNAVAIKMLGGRLPALQIAFLRCLIAFLAILPMIALTGLAQLRTGHLRIHLMRGGFGIVAMTCSYYAVANLPLAAYTALSFTKPLFGTVLAVLLLKESVRWRRWSATAMGFLGVLVMVRPGAGAFEPAAVVALGDAVAIAALMVLVKRLPASETQLAMLFYFGVFSSLGLAGPAIAVWRPVEGGEYLWLLLVALAGLVGQSFFIRAFRAGEASAVAPFDYLRLPVAALVGWVGFAERLDLWTLLGAAVIVASTVYIARREARLRGSGAEAAVSDQRSAIS